MLQSMTIRLIYVHQLETLYLGYGVKCQSGVNWGHWGKKRSKTQKRYSSYRLQGMIMRLMYLHQLDPSTKDITLKIHPGSFGGTGVKSSFSLKML